MTTAPRRPHTKGQEAMGRMAKRDRAKARQRKREEREAEAQAAGVPALASVPSRQPGGRVRPADGRHDTRKVALSARCRQAGIEDNRVTRQDAAHQMMGEPVGLCIREALPRADWPDAWATWCDLSASHRAHARLYVRPASGAALTYVPDRHEAPADMPAPRIETEDEAARRIKARWRRWRALLDAMGRPQMDALWWALRGDGPAIWRGQAITSYGETTARAVRELARRASEG